MGFLTEPIRNLTTLGRRNKKRKGQADLLVIHRSHVADTAAETAEFFYKEKAVGYQMPYHIYIRRDGVVEQAVELSRRAPGALGVNDRAIHVAVEGDLRESPPTTRQGLALVQVCRDLTQWCALCNVSGHDEIKGGSEDPRKECPGSHLNMDGLRGLVKETFQPWPASKADEQLFSKGYVL